MICLPLEPLMTSPIFKQKLEYLPDIPREVILLKRKHHSSFRKKSTTTLSLQNMFRSIIDHRQLKVVDDEFEFHLKLQYELTLLHCR